MAIFDKTNTIFIHIPKTGGTSVSERFKRFNPRKERFKHNSYIEYKKFLKKDFEKYKIFSIIRNPYSRLASYFKYHLINSYLDKIIETDIPVNIKFKFYLLGLIVNKNLKLYTKETLVSKTQVSFLFNEDNFIEKKIKIIKFENINKTRLPKFNISKFNYSLKDLYDKENIEIIKTYYLEDFINFNYSYELPKI
jgi:hypothetical protein